MAANMMACPSIWPGEEQPSLLDQEASLSLSNQAADSEPCLPVSAEQPAHGSSPTESRPPRSKSKGELVIVINERLKNGECDRRAAVTAGEAATTAAESAQLSRPPSVLSFTRQVTGSTPQRATAPRRSSPPPPGGSTPSPTRTTARPGRAAGPAPSATPPSRRGRRSRATPALPPTPRWTAPKSRTTSSCQCWPASAPSGP